MNKKRLIVLFTLEVKDVQRLVYALPEMYLFIYLFGHSQNLTQHEQKVLIKL